MGQIVTLEQALSTMARQGTKRRIPSVIPGYKPSAARLGSCWQPVRAEEPAIEPADADQAQSQRDERSDAQESIEAGSVDEENLRHGSDHEAEGRNAPIA